MEWNLHCENCGYENPKFLLTPIGMAILLKKGKEDKTTDRLNVQRLTNREKDNMKIGIMAFRHFDYGTYHQNIPFAYE